MLRILLPEFKGESYCIGQIKCCDSNITVFVTKLSTKLDTQSSASADTIIYGYLGYLNPKQKPRIKNYIQISPNYEVIKLYLSNQEVLIKNCIIMLYDLDKVKVSQIEMKPSDCTDYFSTLHNLIQEDKFLKASSDNSLSKLQCPGWFASSMTAQHLLCYINLFNWLYVAVYKEQKFQIKHANYVIALLVDLALGYLVLSFISYYNIELGSILMGFLETLVNSLHSLLKWLMGAPAGLKLNNAFNKMLGKYFSYHIQLWWLFLDVSSDKLDVILLMYRKLGYLGATFQAALVCDMFCIATFHSYCIYVYAARLFNIQISGLSALVRLFFGRKRNPLRGGVDSCAYSNQQLFVGTVFFTCLLLLLPTTAMYYIVFTMVRLLALSAQCLLAALILRGRTLPLYITILWLVRSPKVAGNILLEVVESKKNSPVVLRIKLQTKSLRELVQNFRPPVEMCKPVQWTNLIANILTGKQIV